MKFVSKTFGGSLAALIEAAVTEVMNISYDVCELVA